ncbi:MAG: hypothetical protein HQK66_08340 [Desulfamplus sp.]|nr:hypothetical protein [Desulfamplus sp.]
MKVVPVRLPPQPVAVAVEPADGVMLNVVVSLKFTVLVIVTEGVVLLSLLQRGFRKPFQK